ncbi:UDP-glycosyltransferase 90A1 [Vitis vinifera]|uniref:UDP-glycosyltransferase 90A1 n=1 Tax=Vitis vinifera TaxID=29760 RepID=A0A438KAL3_VITVI|nr:UDP-glycosyltransferase 90A1 [Vitis vinifera]
MWYITVTVLTTPANSPSIRSSLLDTTISVVDLPFPVNILGVPPRIESTDKLPFMSFFVPFVTATKLIQPHFEQVIVSLPIVHCIISNGFLGWTQQSADKLGIPRVLFYGMSNYAMTLSSIRRLDLKLGASDHSAWRSHQESRPYKSRRGCSGWTRSRLNGSREAEKESTDSERMGERQGFLSHCGWNSVMKMLKYSF